MARYPVTFCLFYIATSLPFWLNAVHICPAPTKCYCFFNKEIDCLHFDLKTIPNFDQENITFDSIDLGQNRFREVEANAFKNLRVRQIMLWENRKNMTLHRDAFEGVAEYMEYLELAKNKEIATIPSGLFRHSSKLVVLDMQKNKLRSLPPFAFKGALALELIDLHRNSLSRLQAHTFRGLISLQELILSDNNISVIDAKAFLGMRHLQTLNLDRNHVRDLQPKSFRRLENLRLLELSHNDISALFPLMFKGLRLLEVLDLTNNPIQMIADGAMATMENLQHLTIDKAKLSHLRPGMFKGLTSLRELSLNNNNIYSLGDDQFKSLANLWKLYIEHNQLTTVNPCAFVDIHALKSISAYGNPIHCDCAMSWASLDGSPEVLGQCASPEKERKGELAGKQRYSVCTFTGLECGDIPDPAENEPLRMWLRYRRAYRHAPNRYLG